MILEYCLDGLPRQLGTVKLDIEVLDICPSEIAKGLGWW
jgi:hypothetical protein